MITALFSVLVSDGTHERRGWEQQPPHLNSLNKTLYSEAHKTKVGYSVYDVTDYRGERDVICRFYRVTHKG